VRSPEAAAAIRRLLERLDLAPAAPGSSEPVSGPPGAPAPADGGGSAPADCQAAALGRAVERVAELLRDAPAGSASGGDAAAAAVRMPPQSSEHTMSRPPRRRCCCGVLAWRHAGALSLYGCKVPIILSWRACGRLVCIKRHAYMHTTCCIAQLDA